MVTILDAITALNAYPIPKATIEAYASMHNVNLETELTAEVVKDKGFNLVKAEIYLWLSFAPNVSQGGVNYSLSDEQRQFYRNKADAIFAEFGDNNNKVRYGYKGSRL